MPEEDEKKPFNVHSATTGERLAKLEGRVDEMESALGSLSRNFKGMVKEFQELEGKVDENTKFSQSTNGIIKGLTWGVSIFGPVLLLLTGSILGLLLSNLK